MHARCLICSVPPVLLQGWSSKSSCFKSWSLWCSIVWLLWLKNSIRFWMECNGITSFYKIVQDHLGYLGDLQSSSSKTEHFIIWLNKGPQTVLWMNRNVLQILPLELCICYLVVRNKLPPNLVAENNKHLLGHSVAGSGIQAELSWVLP